MKSNQPPKAIELKKENTLPMRFFKKIVHLENGIRLIGDYHAFIRILADDLVKIAILPPDVEESESLCGYKKQWNKTEYIIEEKEGRVELITEKLIVRITKEPFAIDFLTKNGELINGDVPKMGSGYERYYHGCTDKHQDSEQLISESGLRPYLFRQTDESECIYGLGEHLGRLNKKGCSLGQWNSDCYEYVEEPDLYMYGSVPFHIGLKKVGKKSGQAYGLFFDNTHRIEYRLDPHHHGQYHMFADGGLLTYYFMFGPEIPNVLERYTELTGRIQLPNLWALGYHQAHFTYRTAEEVVEVARKHREHRIPLDAMYTDIDYMHGAMVFTFGKGYKKPESWALQLHDLGVRWVAVNDPTVKVESGYFVYEEGLKQDAFVKQTNGEIFIGDSWPGNVVYPDAANSNVRKWWAEKHEVLFKPGADGIWNDMTEPASFAPFGGPCTHFYHTIPMSCIHEEDSLKHQKRQIPHREFHNIFAHFFALAVHEGFERFKPDVRPFVTSRNFFAGTQRLVTVWTGDCTPTWQVLRQSLQLHMNLGLSGFPFVGTDIGGFTNMTSPELMARWIQLGAFYPFARNQYGPFNGESPYPGNELYHYPDWVLNIGRTYLSLRYELLPYTYTQFWKSTWNGQPIQQPLVYQFQEDENTYEIQDQFMWGSDLMVAPVVHKGSQERDVYLPKGQGWVDYWTDEILNGGQSVHRKSPVELMPIYVKMNVIIPRREVQQYVDEQKLRVLQLSIYVDQQAETLFYEDDGHSLAHQRGIYNKMKLEVLKQKKEIIFRASMEHDGFASTIESYLLQIHHIHNKPKKVAPLNGETYTEKSDKNRLYPGMWHYEELSSILYVHLPKQDREEIRILL